MPSHAVSVIVPTYNQARFLRACLDSVWFQDYPGPVEIILVNDGSTDTTRDVIDTFEHDIEQAQSSYASRYDEASDIIERVSHPVYPRTNRTLRILEHDGNKGLAVALNTGFKAATGEYCTYVPSDDLCYPHMLATLARELDGGADFAYSDMLIVNERMEAVRRFSLPDYSFSTSFQDWYLCGVSKLYRRSLHEELGWYDETLLAHDHELFQRFAMAGKRFRHVGQILMALQDHSPPHRQKDIHLPANWNRLYEESKELVRRARAHAISGKGTNRSQG